MWWPNFSHCWSGVPCVPSTAMVQRKKNKLVPPEAEALFQKRGRGESLHRGLDGLKWACTEQPSALSLSLLNSSPERLPAQPGLRSRGKLMQVFVPKVPQSPILTSPFICPHCRHPGQAHWCVSSSHLASCLLGTPPPHPQQLFLLTATTQYS